MIICHAGFVREMGCKSKVVFIFPEKYESKSDFFELFKYEKLLSCLYGNGFGASYVQKVVNVI